MRNNIIDWIVICSLLVMVGCGKEEPKTNIAIRINEFTISLDEFNDELKRNGYAADEQAREKFVDGLINRKLLLQEAETLGLDRKQEFLREVERFWETTLLKNIINRKSKELAGRVSVTESDVRARFDNMPEKERAGSSYEEIYTLLRWQLLREKQASAFDDWLKALRNKSRIEVNKELLGIKWPGTNFKQ